MFDIESQPNNLKHSGVGRDDRRPLVGGLMAHLKKLDLVSPFEEEYLIELERSRREAVAKEVEAKRLVRIAEDRYSAVLKERRMIQEEIDKQLRLHGLQPILEPVPMPEQPEPVAAVAQPKREARAFINTGRKVLAAPAPLPHVEEYSEELEPDQLSALFENIEHGGENGPKGIEDDEGLVAKTILKAAQLLDVSNVTDRKFEWQQRSGILKRNIDESGLSDNAKEALMFVCQLHFDSFRSNEPDAAARAEAAAENIRQIYDEYVEDVFTPTGEVELDLGTLGEDMEEIDLELGLAQK